MDSLCTTTVFKLSCLVWPVCFTLALMWNICFTSSLQPKHGRNMSRTVDYFLLGPAIYMSVSLVHNRNRSHAITWTSLLVWWMRPIYELFFATPCKHPNFWGESWEWYIIINFSGKIQLGDQSVSLKYALPHINTEYGGVCTPSQKWVVLGGFLEVIHQTIWPLCLDTWPKHCKRNNTEFLSCCKDYRSSSCMVCTIKRCTSV